MTARTWGVRSRLYATAGIALALALFAGAPGAWASCTVNPQCFANDEGTGCCNADCTWKATGATCRIETDSCHESTCSAAHVCGSPTGNAQNGSTCFPPAPFNVCSRGECHSGVCGGIGSAGSTEYGARCPSSDPNQCIDHCISDLITGEFIGCAPENIPDGSTCYSSSGLDCQKGECTAGVCGGLSTVVHCSSNAPACKRRTCNPSTLECDAVPDASLTCDDNANDCKDKFCTTSGNCKSNDKPPTTKCVPTASNDDNNTCTEEQCTAAGRCELHVPYSNGSHPPGCDAASSQPCRLATCVDQSGTVTCQQTVDGSQNTQVCNGDTNPCTVQKCDAGSCNYDSCATGACVMCGQNGTCAGTTQANCACTFS